LGTELLERLLKFDAEARGLSSDFIAGIDEAGRGPLAGPVVAAAVILFRSHSLTHLNDSKKISSQNREVIYRELAKHALIGIGIVAEHQIDRLNIYQATRLAMKQAVLSLPRSPDRLLIDGTMKLDLPIRQEAIVKGDARSASIAAASIVAKVCRDAWMIRLDRDFPEYEFRFHKGYATKNHLKKISELGPSPFHRKSFAPVRGNLQKVLFDYET